MEHKSKYDLWHLQQDSGTEQFGIWYRWVSSILEPEDLNNKLVLEIACGRGQFANYLCESYQPRHFYGCDYSADAVQIAQERSRDLQNTTWKQEDIQALGFQSNFFDTIVCCETIEHIPYPGKGLSELYRVLKPGGKLILTCPNYFNFFGIWCLYRKMIGSPYTEGGQPFVNYILMPWILFKLQSLGFNVEHFHSSELILPARVPKTYYPINVPGMFRWFGYRTYYVLRKQ